MQPHFLSAMRIHQNRPRRISYDSVNLPKNYVHCNVHERRKVILANKLPVNYSKSSISIEPLSLKKSPSLLITSQIIKSNNQQQPSLPKSPVVLIFVTGNTNSFSYNFEIVLVY
jgi:hypothetical protein